jgi:hypothetical protein
MPCRTDDWDTPAKETRNGLTIDQLEAALCGILTVLEKEERIFGLDDVDWDEAGVSRKAVDTWWKRHKKEDKTRRAHEEAAKRKNELKKIALGKLTAEELEVLGIKL